MPFQVVLFEPEIPPNTGNIIRLCANTGATLHLIEPFGFEWDNTRLKRAGLDYHDLAHVTRYENFAKYLAQNPDRRLFAFTTKAKHTFSDVTYRPDDAFLYGPETRGLPDHVLEKFDDAEKLRIPMQEASRSLNLFVWES